MRWALIGVFLVGCASSEALERATYNAQACEYTRDQYQAAADKGDANAQAWANRTAVDCRMWRDQVAVEQGRLQANAANRDKARAALQGLAEGQRAAASAYETPTPPRYECSKNYVGGFDCTPR